LGEALIDEDKQDGTLLTLASNLPRNVMRRTMRRSMEADIMVAGDYKTAESIEGTIGELSDFHDTFGYYAQAVDETTCKLPEGWQRRVTKICNGNTNYVSGLCLEIHDLLLSKLVAGREKDIEFFKAAVLLGIVRRSTLQKRVNTLPVSQVVKDEIKVLIDREFVR